MFKDTKKELERLEAELLEDEPEQWDEEDPLLDDDDDFGEETPEVYRNFSNGYGKIRAYNTDITDEDLEQFSEEVRRPKRNMDILVLCAIAMCLVAGIVGVLCWWAVRFMGR